MPIEFICPHERVNSDNVMVPCGKKLRAPDDRAGQQARCPRCNQRVSIPPLVVEPLATNSISQNTSQPPVASSGSRETISRQEAQLHQETQPHQAALPRFEGKVVATGCQRWIGEIVSEGVPASVLGIVMHALFTAIALGSIALVFVSSTGLFRVASLGMIGAMMFFYVATAWKLFEFKRNPAARLAWFQRPFWIGVLWICRLRDWSDGSGQERVVISKINEPLTDDELDRVKSLGDAQVLDLQGTQITDDAMRFFRRIENLQCLVLLETNVTHDAVFRLAQMRPKLWIWY